MIVNMLNTDDTDVMCNYYVFEKIKTSAYSREGKPFEYERIARVNISATLKELDQKLLECAKDYLEHRYHVAADKVFWKEFCAVSDNNIFTVDYSENINLKPKKEVQSAHFSGQKHTLHCCVHQKGDKIDDVNHLSDDTNHNNVMTAKIIEDLIINKVEEEDDTIVLRSDNCLTQFKSRFVFASGR